jgi:hypothetical protein
MKPRIWRFDAARRNKAIHPKTRLGSRPAVSDPVCNLEKMAGQRPVMREAGSVALTIEGGPVYPHGGC